MKPALSGDEPQDVLRYARSAEARRKGPVFPHDPTSRQAFTEAQFESYRILGLHSVQQAFRGGGTWQLRANPVHPVLPGNGGGDTSPLPKPPIAVPVGSPGERPKGPLSTLANPGTLAAAALLTGTIAVTGTVALKDNTLKLEESNVKLAPTELRVSGGDRAAVVADLKAVLDPLERTLTRLTDAIANTRPGGESTTTISSKETTALIKTSQELRSELVSTQKDVSVLRERFDQVVVLKDVVDRLTKATDTLIRSTTTLDATTRTFVNTAAASEADLKEAVKSLREIRDAIHGVSPRRSVSGVGDTRKP